MDALAHALMGALLPLPAWIWLRQQVHARFSAWVLLDAAPWCAAYLICLATTARPLFSGAVVAGALIFMAIAQAAKRATLGDGLVFTDGGLLWQVFAHPRFYLPFVPRPILVLAALEGLAAAVALLSLEPGLVFNPQLRIAVLVVSLALLAVILRPLFLLGRTTPARDPVKDAAHFGPLACFALHARLAAVARPGLQATYSPASALYKATEAAPHLVLLQLESFCDPRRFGMDVPMPHKDTLCGTALSHGALQVSAFGANTMRTEFAVLTGIADTALGLDRFNPYFRLARQPLRSLAWHLRHAGYQTACWHPFNPGFFGRDKVLPARHRLVAGMSSPSPRMAPGQGSSRPLPGLIACGPPMPCWVMSCAPHKPASARLSLPPSAIIAPPWPKRGAGRRRITLSGAAIAR